MVLLVLVLMGVLWLGVLVLATAALDPLRSRKTALLLASGTAVVGVLALLVDNEFWGGQLRAAALLLLAGVAVRLVLEGVGRRQPSSGGSGTARQRH